MSSGPQQPVTPYSPVGDNGFQSQQQQHNPQVDPEEFYRASPPAQLNTLDNGNRQEHSTSPISPADSQAPIMGVGEAQDYPPPPQMSYPPPPTVEEESSLPSPKIPVVDNCRTSMGVVNGEISVYPAPPPPPPPAQLDPLSGISMPMTPLTPALKTPVFKEDAEMDKYDSKVRKYDKRDLAVKLKIRLAKVFLRSINCACSLVVLSLVASTFSIFNATKSMPPRNNLPPWATSTPQWPQTAVLVIAIVSLCISLYIMYGYWRGGHKRAEKVAVYSTIFAVGVFIFTIIMWAIAAGIMQRTRDIFEGKDIWGWSCKDNTRRKLFEQDINYKLVCLEQDWVTVCAIIEIVVEVITIGIYGFAFYRLASKRKLRKSMDVRDKARSDLWLTKLREQQAAEANESNVASAETDANTTYNGTAGIYAGLPDAEEGHAQAPIVLQRPPRGHYATAPHKARDISPPNSSGDKVPPTPRSVSFQAPQPPGVYVPPPPASATFPLRTPPTSSGSQK